MNTTDQSPAKFNTLPLPSALLDNLSKLGFIEMTPVQQATLPSALTGKDILAKAKTGSGKTASFAIPMLEKINPRFLGVQAVILCPTRELAKQVADECRKLARYKANIKILTLSGGTSIGPQIGSLEHGAHIVVGTPGRICDHLRKKTLTLSNVSTFVLDEADKMVDMGFIDSINDIRNALGSRYQTLFFSATFPKKIDALATEFLQNPEIVSIDDTERTSQIEQVFIPVNNQSIASAVPRLIHHYGIKQAVIFCNTKIATHEVTAELRHIGHSASGLHGDLEQRDRDRILLKFKQGSLSFLVATDVAARGLDVENLPVVINAELPRDSDTYTHRIGRTGRAGNEGMAYSLYPANQQHKLERIAEHQKVTLSRLISASNNHTINEIEWDITMDEMKTAVEKPNVVTIAISGGRKHKLRPGDILGALTKNNALSGSDVGNITIMDYQSYVALQKNAANKAIQHLEKTPIKGRSFKVRRA